MQPVGIVHQKHEIQEVYLPSRALYLEEYLQDHPPRVLGGASDSVRRQTFLLFFVNMKPYLKNNDRLL